MGLTISNEPHEDKGTGEHADPPASVTVEADDVTNAPVKADELPESVTTVADDVDNKPADDAGPDAKPETTVADFPVAPKPQKAKPAAKKAK